MKKYLHSATLGIALGALISIVTSFAFAGGEYSPINPFSTMGMYYVIHFNPATIMLISVCIWAMIGIFFQAADSIFHQDWSLMRMSVTHFLVSVVGFAGLAILAGWFPLNIPYLLFFFVLFIFIYAVIYIVNYRQMRASVAEINQGLGK